MKRLFAVLLSLLIAAPAVAVDQWDIVGRLTAGTGPAESIAVTDLTEIVSPAAGDYLVCWASTGELRKCDVGDLPGGGWDGDIADINLDGGTDIGADLADADLILVDDGGAGTNRKSAASRLKKYIGKEIIWRITNDVSQISSGTDDLACFYWTSGAFTITSVSASVNTQGGTSGTLVVDIHDDGTTIMGTNKLDIAYNANVDDGTASVSAGSIANDSKLCAQVDQVSTGGTEKGLVITLQGHY
jgi:hypothetical protein